MGEDPAQRAARYFDRKTSGRCVDCDAGLPDDSETVRCLECAERDRESQSKYNATPHGRATRRRIDRDAYGRRVAAGAVCRKCGKEPAPGKNFCQECRDRNTAMTRQWRARKRQGIVSIESARRKRDADRTLAPPTSRDVRRYRPIEERLAVPRVRMLRALRFLGVGGEWSSAAEIFAACEIPEHDEHDADVRRIRDAYTSALRRLRMSGLLERAELSRAWAVYRLTELGRAKALELSEVAP